jgi:hypothetical protein
VIVWTPRWGIRLGAPVKTLLDSNRPVPYLGGRFGADEIAKLISLTVDMTTEARACLGVALWCPTHFDPGRTGESPADEYA